MSEASSKARPVELDIVENNNRLILFDFAVFCKMRSFQQAANSGWSPHGRWWQSKEWSAANA
jgi:hypothetical protein